MTVLLIGATCVFMNVLIGCSGRHYMDSIGSYITGYGEVILQVSYFKITHGKRIFLMTPIHHHFEMKGWKETQVVVRFWIITIVLVLIGLSTLKIR